MKQSKVASLNELIAQVAVIERSFNEPTEVRFDQSLQTTLRYAAQKVSKQCTALAIGLQGQSCTDETAREGCRITQDELLRLLTVLQVTRRDESELVFKAMSAIMTLVFESAVHLFKLLKSDKNKKSVSPGVGLVWAECAKLETFEASTLGQVKTMLMHAENCVGDTLSEIQELTVQAEGEAEKEESAEISDENDDFDDFDDVDSFVTVEEMARINKVVPALKAARGIFKGSKSLADGVESDAKLFAQEIPNLISRLTRAVEDLGCALYSPQIDSEVSAATKEVAEALDALVEGFLRLTLSEKSRQSGQKMRDIAKMLCAGALAPVEGEELE